MNLVVLVPDAPGPSTAHVCALRNYRTTCAPDRAIVPRPRVSLGYGAACRSALPLTDPIMVPRATRPLDRGTSGSFLGTNALLSTALRDWAKRSQNRFATRLDDPQGIVSEACALQGVVALPRLWLSGDFTVARFQESSLVPKLMNQRDFTLLGTHLASTRDRNVGMTQRGLWDSV